MSHVRIDRITPDVVYFGFRAGLLERSDVVGIELDRYRHGAISPDSPEEALALLLRDDHERVFSLLDEAHAEYDGDLDTAVDVWAYVGLARLRLLWESFEDPWDAVEFYLSVLGQPERYNRFLRHMPLPRGERGGLDHMARRLDQYLADEHSVFSRDTTLDEA
jgi:hypothetical protein